jgi:hypothetical protein
VNEFVEECVREWRRLGVADAAANEMAAELTADLAEAAAEGATTEAVLGTSAFEPRAFAGAWATERGVVPPEPQLAPPPQPEPPAPPPLAPTTSETTTSETTAPRRRRWVPALVAVFALVGVAGAGLTLLSSARETSVVVSKQVPVNPDGSPVLKPSPGFRLMPPALKQLPGAVVIPPDIEAGPRFVVPGPDGVVSVDHRGRNLGLLGFFLVIVGVGGAAFVGLRRTPTGWWRRREA